MADHDGCPFRPIGIDQSGGEALLWQFIHKPADLFLDIREIIPGD
jgi:hypothetical protein